ncbi:imidazolonepropionase [Chitinophaga nivalis]|uniref:Imidazolonepropionase n=1 Tax=Chitinophaga nivalis TaxID=2991709 RepID=A0ABT3IRH1_9BACT|nr:imidazolonepropionase [Chitinophaga nivalis]MCW3463729.1 imidazolonepropionase [Chitinophaga nivalis]MCW3486581.1 imidazolonepropionase [Chitinophaga nivalis]
MLLIGPFAQILPMTGLSLKGALQDEQLTVIEKGGIVVEEGRIVAVGEYLSLQQQYPASELAFIDTPMVLLPGFIDCHTHICYDGTRNRDYAMRIAGKTYLEIARAGGGIWDSVSKTRVADTVTLVENTIARANRHLLEGVTTIEVKSGYGLNLDSELKMLRAIQRASMYTKATLVPTCLAAHMKPRDYTGTEEAYLDWIIQELLPVLKTEQLTNRVDIFIEETAFSAPAAADFLHKARQLGFAATVHADQFSAGGSAVAVAAGALSADHLEASSEKEINLLAKSDTVAVVLPGASLGLGMQYAPARKLLDAGASVAIASDWNPGSAPMGDLLIQAAVMSAAEKLSTAEVLAALTVRAAPALEIRDAGQLQAGFVADLQAYPTADYRDILYYQGKMKPAIVWKKGEPVK